MEKEIIMLEELAEFIVEAKKNGYASNRKEEIMNDGSRKWFFQKEPFYYEDNFKGGKYFFGNEEVRREGRNNPVIWGMSYFGGMLKEYMFDLELKRKTYEFLKEVLSKVEKDFPFRGPKEFEEGDFRYFNSIEGDIERFKGAERILARLEGNPGYTEVYSLDYLGGLLIQ